MHESSLGKDLPTSPDDSLPPVGDCLIIPNHPQSGVPEVGHPRIFHRQDRHPTEFIHDGTRHIQARPFHLEAVEAQDLPHRRGMRAALRSTLGGGSRFRLGSSVRGGS